MLLCFYPTLYLAADRVARQCDILLLLIHYSSVHYMAREAALYSVHAIHHPSESAACQVLRQASRVRKAARASAAGAEATSVHPDARAVT